MENEKLLSEIQRRGHKLIHGPKQKGRWEDWDPADFGLSGRPQVLYFSDEEDEEPMPALVLADEDQEQSEKMPLYGPEKRPEERPLHGPAERPKLVSLSHAFELEETTRENMKEHLGYSISELGDAGDPGDIDSLESIDSDDEDEVPDPRGSRMNLPLATRIEFIPWSFPLGDLRHTRRNEFLHTLYPRPSLRVIAKAVVKEYRTKDYGVYVMVGENAIAQISVKQTLSDMIAEYLLLLFREDWSRTSSIHEGLLQLKTHEAWPMGLDPDLIFLSSDFVRDSKVNPHIQASLPPTRTILSSIVSYRSPYTARPQGSGQLWPMIRKEDSPNDSAFRRICIQSYLFGRTRQIAKDYAEYAADKSKRRLRG
jgi:hypothetical protein